MSLHAAGALPAAAEAALEAHLAHCPICRRRLAELQALVGRLQQTPDRLATAEPSPGLRTRWQHAVRAAGAPATIARGAPVAAGDPGNWLGQNRWAWGAIAAGWAAILLLQTSAPALEKPGAAAPPITVAEARLALDRLQAADPLTRLP